MELVRTSQVNGENALKYMADYTISMTALNASAHDWLHEGVWTIRMAQLQSWFLVRNTLGGYNNLQEAFIKATYYRAKQTQ